MSKYNMHGIINHNVKSFADEKLRFNIRQSANVIKIKLKTTITAFNITSLRIGKHVFD